MDRKKFLKQALLAGAAGAMLPPVLKAGSINPKNSDYDLMMEQVGFNHLPNIEDKTMNSILHKAGTRGHADHGWLNSYHTFSFANYYNPDRMHFGVLRVLNDDTVEEGKGFGTHPHDNMEIISIPLEGDLEHKDSMGNIAVIREGDVQVMSAGTGIFHSEYNKNTGKKVKFLQIWVFPKRKDVTPRYDQVSLKDIEKKNEFFRILSPDPEAAGVWIHQDAWFNLGEFVEGASSIYKLNKTGNGVYAFIIDGEVEIDGQKLEKRDGYGIWDVSAFKFKSLTSSKVLLMEVPMEV
jgi:redox-sensitive bicupin YhaK (pirin superfamily)